MSVQYTVLCKNDSDQSWTFGVYQKQSDVSSGGQQGLAWQQKAISSQAQGYMYWSFDFRVAVASVNPTTQVYFPVKSIAATVGKGYSIFTDSNSALDIKLDEQYDEPNEIVLHNGTTDTQLAGFELGGVLIAVMNEEQNLNENYTVAPKYFIGAYKDLVHGTILTSSQSTVGVPLDFPAGMTNATATLGADNVMTVTYSAEVPTVSRRSDKCHCKVGCRQ